MSNKAEQTEEVNEIEKDEVDEIESQDEDEEGAENQDPGPAEAEAEEEDEDEEDVLVSFDGKEPEGKEEEQPAPGWVKDLRKAHRTTQKENRDLRKKIESLETPKPKISELSKKPTLEDHDYDADDFGAALESWFNEKRKNEDAKAHAKSAEDEQTKAWNNKQNAYRDEKDQLKVSDYADVEEDVLASLSDEQQGIILVGATKPALFVYALGKNPEKLKELSSIKDPVQFAVMLGSLEKDMKMSKKTKRAPNPERRVTGSASGSALDTTLEKLRTEAAKTGNYSKVSAYKQQRKK